MNVNKGMYHHIITACHAGNGVLLELGSGETSRLFVEHGIKVYSVEHDTTWLGKYEGVNYIHAPLVPQNDVKHEYFQKTANPYWYDHNVLAKELPEEYDVLLLDGPPRMFRPMFFYNWAMFRTDVPWFADDLNRPEWYRALLWTCRERGLSTFPEVRGLGSGHEWVVIPPNGR